MLGNKLLNKNKNQFYLPASIIGSLLLAMSVTFAHADSLFPDEQDLFADVAVTSATRLAQSPRDLPISVTIIDREMIEATGATEIPELFRIVAGFRVAHVTGSEFSVSGHSPADQFARKLEILVDGRRVQSAVLNFTDWSALEIDIDDIDYIEVMRGTSAAVYGANAFDGAINIITRKPFEDNGVYIRTLSGDPGVKSSLFRYGFKTATAEHSIKLSERFTKGFSGREDDARYTKLRYRGNFNPSPVDEVDVQFGYTTGYVEEDGDGVVVRDRPRETDTSSQYVRWRHLYENGDDFEIKVYHNRVKYDDTYLTANLSEIFGINPALVPALFGGRSDQPLEFAFFTGTSDRYGFEAQRSYSYKNIRFVTGIGLFYDDIKSDFLFRDDGKSSDTNKQLFGNLEWQLNKDTVFNAALLIEDNNGTKPTTSSRLALNYHLNRNNTFRISAAQSFRSRSAYGEDLFLASTYTSDGSILDVVADYRDYDQPEKITSFELGHLYELPEHGLSLDWKLYHDRYSDVRSNVSNDNYIDELGNGASTTVNGGEFFVRGIDLQFRYRPSNKGFIALQYSYAEPGGEVIDDITPSIDFEEIDFEVPKNSFSILVSRKVFNNWNISMQYSSLSETEWEGSGDDLPRYERLDARIAKDFKVGGSEARVELIAHNLLREYIEFRDENVFGRRALLRLSLQY